MKTINDRLADAEYSLMEADHLLGINTPVAHCIFLRGILEALLAFAGMMMPGAEYIQREEFDPKEREKNEIQHDPADP